MTALYLGLVNWLVTLIVVESELTRPVRDWIDDKALLWGDLAGPDYDEIGHWRRDRPLAFLFGKLRYVVGCHLCAGTWVGFLLAAIYGGPVTGRFSVVANGLIYKAVGHVVLEVTAALKRANTGGAR